MKTTVSIAGLKDINATLANLPRGTTRSVLLRFGRKRLEPMRDAAKAKVHKDTHELEENIIISTKQRTGRKRTKARIDADVEIFMGPSTAVGEKAIPQEFGFRGVPPSGYMRGAWDENHSALLDNIAQDLGKAATGAGKRYAKKQARG